MIQKLPESIKSLTIHRADVQSVGEVIPAGQGTGFEEVTPTKKYVFTFFFFFFFCCHGPDKVFPAMKMTSSDDSL